MSTISNENDLSQPIPLDWEEITSFLETAEGFDIDDIATYFRTTTEAVEDECLEKFKISFETLSKKYQKLGRALIMFTASKLAVSGDRSLLIELRRKIEAEATKKDWD